MGGSCIRCITPCKEPSPCSDTQTIGVISEAVSKSGVVRYRLDILTLHPAPAPRTPHTPFMSCLLSQPNT